MTTVGIVGAEEAKFDGYHRLKAHTTIGEILMGHEQVQVVSGACPLGGVDVWAIEMAETLGHLTLEFPPAVHNWAEGFKPRNIHIAEASDILHVIVVKEYHPLYQGKHWFRPVEQGHYVEMKPWCYHCKRFGHVKSGACWTAKYAQKLGKPAIWWEL